MNRPFDFAAADRKRVEALRSELRRHNELYYTLAAPEILDDRYDALMEELRGLEEEHPEWSDPESPTRRVGATPEAAAKRGAFSAFLHTVPMLSIANTYSADEVRKFVGRMEGALRDAGNTEPARFVVELKIDGLAFTAFYRGGKFVRGATRGDGVAG